MTSERVPSADPWQAYRLEPFEAEGIEHDVLRRGVPDRPVVIVLHELPGLTRHTAALADLLVDRGGFSVTIPILLPPVVPSPGWREVADNVRRICVSAEFAALARFEDRPLTRWLRALAHAEAERTSHPVGVVGMCMTGAFALATAVDPVVGAAVASQPSVPFALFGWTQDLAMSARSFKELAERAEAGFCVRALRFSRDRLSPGRRMELIRSALPNSDIVEVPSRSPMDHSVLTAAVMPGASPSLVQALQGTLEYLQERLAPEGAPMKGGPAT